MGTDNIKKALIIPSWALYDLSNQFFAINIISLYFVRWLTLEKKVPEIFYSIAFSFSLLLVGILAPVLGAVSDATARRRVFLVAHTLVSVFFTSLLAFTSSVFWALLFFVLANFGCQMASVFYNAQLAAIAPRGKVGIISGFGRMTGYSGAVLALLLTRPIFLSHGYQAVFLITGALFLFFALPCMFFVKDVEPKAVSLMSHFLKRDKFVKTFMELKVSSLNALKTPGLLDFLKAAFFGLSAVNAVILFMSVYVSRVFGLGGAQIVELIVFSAFFAVFGSFFSGVASDLLGCKRTLCFVFILWMVSFLLGAMITDISLASYRVIGALVGIALGSIWTVSRALVTKMVPAEKMGEVFGLFNLAGYISGIAGALFWGLILFILRPADELDYRIALLSLEVFMVLGLVFLLRIPETKKAFSCAAFLVALLLAPAAFADNYAQKDGLFWIDVPQEWVWSEDTGGVSIVSPTGSQAVRINIEAVDNIGTDEDALQLVRDTMSAKIADLAWQNGRAVLKTQRKVNGIFALQSGFIISSPSGIRQATAIVFLKDGRLFNIYFEASREFQRMEMEAIVDTLKFEAPEEEYQEPVL
ncbi:MAG TPA: hypothetical protein DCL35_05735 [Candidatus Omnitrophica bacterium]|nr:hypothetical protein [Candidatus Omnitrophota bacterium]